MTSPNDTHLLVVDDNPNDRSLLIEHLTGEGYHTEVAVDGADAWDRLESNPSHVDVILLDKMMPRMTGLELCLRIKKHPQLNMVPVIFQTAANDRQDVLDGIRAGAYYYLTKPYDKDMLLSIVRTAASDYSNYKELQREVRKNVEGLGLLRDARFVYRTIEHAHDLGAILANTTPDPTRTVIGLTELLVNAVEHGNLGITYQEKSKLNGTNRWMMEIERRLAHPDNVLKKVEVRFERDENQIRFTIRDDGPGFDWKPFLEIDPQRAFDTHGRGIAMANLLSFDALEYHGSGSEVVGTVHLA